MTLSSCQVNFNLRTYKLNLNYCLLGSIWTFILRVDENDPSKCEVLIDQDSNHNKVNIFLLVPQYVVITIGEVSSLVVQINYYQIRN